MKTSSAKSKGRKLQQTVVLKFKDIFKDVLMDGDIKSTPMGVNGVDVALSPTAELLIPYDIECKNVESLVSSTMKDAILQAESNTSSDRIPLLVFKSNNQPERVILRLSDFLNVVYPNQDITINSNNKKRLLIEIEKLKNIISNL